MCRFDPAKRPTTSEILETLSKIRESLAAEQEAGRKSVDPQGAFGAETHPVVHEEFRDDEKEASPTASRVQFDEESDDDEKEASPTASRVQFDEAAHLNLAEDDYSSGRRLKKSFYVGSIVRHVGSDTDGHDVRQPTVSWQV